MGLAHTALALDDDAERVGRAGVRLAEGQPDLCRDIGVQAFDVKRCRCPDVVERAGPVESQRREGGQLIGAHRFI
jgi:hypothetical protein